MPPKMPFVMWSQSPLQFHVLQCFPNVCDGQRAPTARDSPTSPDWASFSRDLSNSPPSPPIAVSVLKELIGTGRCSHLP